MQWLSNGLNFIKGYKTYAILGVVAVAAVTGAFGAGYLIGGRAEARIQIREVEKRIYVPVKEIQEVQVRNIERERQLQIQLTEARGVAADLRRQMAATPDPLPDSCLSGDSVRLLNQAIANGAPTDPASVPASETDCVAPRVLELWAADAAEQYNDVSARYNGLIDWSQEELIDPQQEQ